MAAAREHVTDPVASFAVGRADALPLESDEADAVVSGLVLNFVPDVPAALADAIRVTRPGGTVAAYVWDYAGRMELMRRFWDAAVALDPDARELDEGVRFPFCAPDRLAAAWINAGLSNVLVMAIDVPDALRRLRRLLAAVHGRHRSGARLRLPAAARSPRGAARAAANDPAHRPRGHDRPHRARLGDPRPGLTRPACSGRRDRVGRRRRRGPHCAAMDLTLTPAQTELRDRARAYVVDALQPLEAEFERNHTLSRRRPSAS